MLQHGHQISDEHSRAQMIVLNPMFRHIASENTLVGLTAPD